MEMCTSESERKTEVESQAGRRDSDMRIPLRLTPALNLEVRKREVQRDGVREDLLYIV